MASWIKAKWPRLQVGIMDMLRCPDEIVVPSKTIKNRPFTGWSKPVVRELKFNVDGASVGKPGPAGIGGILRDYLGNVRIKFSKSIRVAELNLAEIMAVKESFILFLAAPWLHNNVLSFERDSKNVVSWVLDPNSAPWRVMNIVLHIENLKTQVMNWKITHIFRESSQDADSLAKAGINRRKDLLTIMDNLFPFGSRWVQHAEVLLGLFGSHGLDYRCIWKLIVWFRCVAFYSFWILVYFVLSV
ncbi:hypothetical protein DITRI_Ditri16bG0110200 [Diplodiscus trichospermus]